MNQFLQTIKDNVIFFGEFMGLIVLTFLVAYALEKWNKRQNGDTERILSTKKITAVGMLSAIALGLMLIELPVFFAPVFYKLDFSELPALIGGFALGPVAGVMIEFVKIMLKIVFKPTSTAFVGELANFTVGCCLVLPATVIYQHRKSKLSALLGCVAGTVLMTIFGTSFNAIYLLPKFAEMYGMPLEALVAMGTELNKSIVDVTSFVVLAVAPLNILKGGLVSIVTMLVYKPLSPVIKALQAPVSVRRKAVE